MPIISAGIAANRAIGNSRYNICRLSVFTDKKKGLLFAFYKAVITKNTTMERRPRNTYATYSVNYVFILKTEFMAMALKYSNIIY